MSDHGLIETCLDSLAGSRPSAETEVVVVANGLGGPELSSLRSRDDVVLVRSAVNTGFSGGNNLAARFARGRYLLLLNDDSVVEAGYIDRLLGAVQRDPSIAAVGGKILSADGSLQEAGSVLWSDGWAAHVGAGLPANSTAYHYVRYADYVSANGLLVVRQAWDAVGGFDERYFPAYYEDVDLCLALWEHGYRVAYEPRARLTHLESQSTSAPFRNFLLIRNRDRLVAKWSALLQDFGDRPDPVDVAAIDAAVYRAERSIGRVLVVEDSADATAWRAPLTVEAMAIAGWSVILSVPVDLRQNGSGDRNVRDRMTDLGVDVREERPEDLVSRYGDSLEAVVASGEVNDVVLSLLRPDGNSIPLLGVGEDPDDSVLARLTDLARRGAESSPPMGAHPTKDAVATHNPSVWAPEHFGGVAEGVSPPTMAATTDAARRDLKFAQADAAIRREYSEFLEHEQDMTRAALDETQAALDETQAALDETQAALEQTDAHLHGTVQALDEARASLDEMQVSLDEKERYIDSLPSIRVKKWIVDRYPNSKS